MFKKGDIVRCIPTGARGAGWKLNLKFTIERISCGNIAFPAERGNGVYFSSLELVKTTKKNYEIYY